MSAQQIFADGGLETLTRNAVEFISSHPYISGGVATALFLSWLAVQFYRIDSLNSDDERLTKDDRLREGS